MRLAPDAKVFTIDTGVLFEETVETWREVEHRYGVKVEVFDATSPDGDRVDRRALLRRAEGRRARQGARGPRRLDHRHAPRAGPDPRRRAQGRRGTSAHGLWKFNPLADWTEKDVWNFIHEHDLPYNKLHDQGYASIGCAPCTQPGSGREGRWAGEDKTECGIHVVESA